MQAESPLLITVDTNTGRFDWIHLHKAWKTTSILNDLYLPVSVNPLRGMLSQATRLFSYSSQHTKVLGLRILGWFYNLV